MDITIEELNALTENTSSMRVKIADLERQLSEKIKEIEEKEEENRNLRIEISFLREEAQNAKIENSLLRNIIMLSGERIKNFMKRVTGIERWAFLRTFIECAIPDWARKEQMKLLDEVMELPEEMEPKPKVVMETPTFQGPMYDVHNNNEVRLEE